MDFDRPSQTRPTVLGAGLLGEEQFDVALILKPLEDLQSGKEPNRLQECDLNLFKLHYPDFSIKKCEVGVEAISIFMTFILTQYSPTKTNNLRKCWSAALSNTWLQSMHYISGTRGILHDQLMTILDSLKTIPNPSLTQHLRRLSGFSVLVLGRIKQADYAYQCRIVDSNYFPKDEQASPTLILHGDSSKMTLTFGRRLVLMRSGEGEFLLTLDQWTMFHNKTVELWITLMYAFLGEKIQYSDGFHERILKFVKYNLKQVRRLGNKAYTYLSNMEGFFTSLVILRSESWKNDALFLTMWQLLSHGGFGIPYDYEDWEMYDLFESCSVQELIELCGVTKLSGHPDIQSKLGFERLYDRTHKYIEITEESVDEVVNMIKKDFCKQFLKRHGKWPLLDLSPGCPETLLRAVLSHKWIDDPELVRRYGAIIDLNTWLFVRLRKNMEFDWVESHMPFLKDRALAPKFSQFTRLQAGDYRVNPEARRVLLHFLLCQNVFSLTSKYLEKYGDDPTSVIDYLVIKLTQKEKELKIGGRMFGQSPYEERLRRCLMEHNVSRLMVDYDPYQSMTTNEHQKILKLLMFRALRRDIDDGSIIQFSVDVEAWNNYFRPALVNTVGKEFFDSVFGTTLYEHTMDTYMLSFFYGDLGNGEIESWQGQAGGIEGLSQKIWTWIYARVALRVIESLGYRGYIMVCGDDLRIAIHFPSVLFREQEKSEVAEDFKNRLKDAFDRYGFKMKATETVASETFIAYGKVYQVGDSFMPSAFKKVAKIHGFQGTTFPLIEQQVASIYSNAHAACQATTSHVSLHLLAGFITGIRLWGKPGHFFSEQDLLELLSRPSVLGGLPILHLHHFMVRGESDHLVLAISFAIFLISSGFDNRLGWSLLTTPLDTSNAQVNFLQLLSDPYCLPISKPESATAYLKKTMENHIKRIVRNKAVSQVIRIFSERNQRLFVKSLQSMTPCLAKVLAVLWECSPFNILSEVVQKFESSRSIFQLLCYQRRRGSIYRILEVARKKEYATIKWLLELSKRPVSQEKEAFGQTYDEFCEGNDPVHFGLIICPTRYSQALRDYAWKVPVLTVTYPCMPDFLRIYAAHDTYPISYQLDHIQSRLTLPQDPINIHFWEGHKSPWVGTSTSEKLLLPQAGLDFEGSISVKVSKILKLIEFTRNAGPDMHAVISWIIEKVSGHTLEHFIPIIPGRTGGTISHRLRSRSFCETVMLNELPNRSQLIAIHHDSHSLLQSKTGDFSINYMAMLLHHLTMILFPLELSSWIDKTKYGEMFYSQVVMECTDCFYDVADNQEVTQECPLPDIDPLPEENPLVGFTVTLQEELIRKYRQLGLPRKHEVFYREQLGDDVTDDVAQAVVASALIRETFGASLEAYHLGIQLEYEGQLQKLDALHNVQSKAKLSLSDWKAVSPIALMNALIQETFQWVLRDPNLRRGSVADILEIPPQLNPFVMVAYKLTMCRKVRSVAAAFEAAGYVVRPLGALDLTQSTQCARWLHASCMPLALQMFRHREVNDQMYTFFSYESDEHVLDRVNRSLMHGCRSYYQHFMKTLSVYTLNGNDLEGALSTEFGSQTALYALINDARRHNRMHDYHLRDFQHLMLRQTADAMTYGGVFPIIDEIPIGRSQYEFIGVIDEARTQDFFVDQVKHFTQWPMQFPIERDLTTYGVLPEEDYFDIADQTPWPELVVNRFGLHASVIRIRELHSLEIQPEVFQVPLNIVARSLIQIGNHRSRLTEMRDMRMLMTGSGCEQILTQAIIAVPQYEHFEDGALPLSHLTRLHGHTITSVVKLHEICIRTHAITELTRVGPAYWGICLADGEGGFSNYLLGLSKRCHIIFNTLYSPNPNEPLAHATPGEVLISGDTDKCIRCKSSHNYTGSNDLTSVQTIKEIKRLSDHYTGDEGVSIVTFDAEGKNLDNNERYVILVRNVLVLILRCLHKDGTAILKFFLNKSETFWALIHTFCDLFQYCRFIKPDSSHSLSGEFYIVVSRLNFDRTASNTISHYIMEGRIFGPANPEFLDELYHLIDQMTQRRYVVRQKMERPQIYIQWALHNWISPYLPKFTWGILFRRLSLTAPAGIVDPLTKELLWSDDLQERILYLAHTSYESHLQAIQNRENRILPHTTHTHLCHRLGLFCRISGFVYLLQNPVPLERVNPTLLDNIVNQLLDVCVPIAAPFDQNGIVTPSFKINEGLGNLEVNLQANIQSGMSLGLRLLTAIMCTNYYRQGNPPVDAPIHGLYLEER